MAQYNDLVNFYFLVATLAGFTAGIVHGVIVYRIIMTPLTPDRLFPTHSFGDADMTRRIMVVTWHLPTAVAALSGVVLTLLAFGVVTTVSVALFISAVHASFILVGLWVARGRFGQVLRPIPITFFASHTTVCLMAWLGSR